MTTTIQNTETPEEALARIQNGSSKNDVAAILAFMETGIAPHDLIPRETILTYHAWQGKGRQVAYGMESVKVTVWAPVFAKNESGERVVQGFKPRLASLFHVSQTVPAGSPKGTKPDAWQNPKLVKEGAYTDDE